VSNDVLYLYISNVIVIIYSAIAPLILLVGVVAFALLWFIYRYYFLYLGEGAVETGGLAYAQALSQLFTGVYTLELCVSGLFLLARNDTGDMVCIPQLLVMVSTMIATGLCQARLAALFGSRFHAPCEGSESPSDLVRSVSPSHEIFKKVGIWLPKDGLGVSDSEIARLRSVDSGIKVTNDGATIDEKGKMHCLAPPAGFSWSKIQY